MSQKKAPPPPAFPPAVKVKENFCFLHKGDLRGDLYTCPACKSKYCLDCVKKAKSEGKSCVKCKQIFLIK